IFAYGTQVWMVHAVYPPAAHPVALQAIPEPGLCDRRTIPPAREHSTTDYPTPPVFTFDHLHDWDRAVDRILRQDGPIFVDLHVEPGEHYPEDFRRLYAIAYRARFRHVLANS